MKINRAKLVLGFIFITGIITVTFLGCCSLNKTRCKSSKISSPPVSNEPVGEEKESPVGWQKLGICPQAPVIAGKLRGKMDCVRKFEASAQNKLSPEMMNVNQDELWVIVKPEKQPGTTEDRPGCGAMMGTLPKQDKEIPLPLKHTDVKARVDGYIATVEVTQQFHNPYAEKIEASYIFPLPDNAAVNEFIMIIGDRKIRGVIREREEAEKIYQQARDQGYTASLLTQERPNIFTQKVANIEPGKQIDVNIKYFNTLTYADGAYEFVFPMVVGPRFNPPGSTTGVGAVARGNAGASGQTTEVQYLKPGERSGHDISLSLDIDAGVTIEEITCRSHVIAKTSSAPEKPA